MQITRSQVEAAFPVARAVFNGSLTREKGAATLHDKHGLNTNSARDLIDNYRHMREGNVFHRAMSAPTVDYFLGKIFAEHGEVALQSAVLAVEKFIEYYNGIRKIKLRSLPAVVARHKKRIPAPPLLAEIEASFNAAVQEASADPPSKRQARLLSAARMPAKVRVVTETYVRNPDVVAEVLYRASGTCQHCHKQAPFIRRKDGTPYLEVHHRKQLIDGGEDSVENALALCPNCHRELHYGI